MKLLPFAVLAAAVFICSISAVFVGIKVFGNKKPVVATSDPDIDEPIDKPTKAKDPKTTPTPKTGSTEVATNPTDPDIPPQNTDPTGATPGNAYNLPAGKKYPDLSDAERRQYLEDRAMRIAQVIGNNNSNKIPPEALDKIKGFADAYASRLKVKPLAGGCRFGDNLQSTY